MSAEAEDFDQELIDYVEGFQYQHLLQAGFDPDRFAERNDADEVSLPARLAAHCLRLALSAAGRRDRAAQIGVFLDYARARSWEAPRLRELIAERTATDPAPVTRYQRRDDHSFLIEMRTLIRGALERLPDSDPLRGMIGTIDTSLLATAPIGRCNASIKSGGDGRSFAIILDDEIVRLAGQMGFLFAELVSETPGGMNLDSRRAEELLGRADGPILQFGKIVRGFVIDGSSLMAVPPATPSRFATDVMTTFAQLAVIFILAHEYSHAFLGHTNDRRQQLRLMDEDEDGESDREERSRMLAIETEADANARAVVQCVCRFLGCDPGLAAAAAIAILSVYNAVYCSIAASASTCDRNGPSRVEAIVGEVFRHPPPAERLRKLIDTSVPAEVWAYYVAERLARYSDPAPPSDIHPRWTSLVSALERA